MGNLAGGKLTGSGSGKGIGSTQVIIAKTVTADDIVGSVPNGYAVEIINTMETGGVAVNVNYGITSLGSEIIGAIPISAGASDLSFEFYNPNADESGFNIYISNNLSWGTLAKTASLDIYIILRKIK